MDSKMDNVNLDFGSKRSESARIGVMLNNAWLFLFTSLMIVLFVVGAILIYLSIAFGWVLIGFSFVPLMIVEWKEGDLKDLAPSTKPTAIDDVLDGSMLGKISSKTTPKQLVEIVGHDIGGQFMMVRFGIGLSFLSEIVSDERNDMAPIWNEAWQIFKKTNCNHISGPILVIALIKQSANFESLINHLQLDESDLINGLNWYEHLQAIIKQQSVPKSSGGIARDWSFGYAPLLNRFAVNISQQIGLDGLSLIELEAHKSALEQLEDIFSKLGRQNAVLVGGEGAGKSEIVRALAARLLDADSELSDRLKFNQVFMLDAAALISAAPGRGELESLVPRIFSEAYRAKNAILFMNNAELFFEESVGSVDLTNVIQPILEAGNLRIILSMNEQQYLRVVKRNPALESAVNKIIINPASEQETIAVMQDRAVTVEIQNNATFMYQALKEVYRLSERYIPDLAMPGKALQLLEAAAHYSEKGLVTVRSVDEAIEKSLGIKVGSVNDDSEKDKLINMESLIHHRMVGQEKVVKVVCDAIRRARAGVRNQNRPIGTFLFLGPTGVGKTELAKSLSDVYFDGEDHMIRIDMNEYSTAADSERLIADAATNANSLTAMVMKRPFSVILLDEIEKAHPSILLMLLQMLDEGVLRDTNNRQINFRDCIIVATSNAGADMIREYIERGYDIEKFESQFVNELITNHKFSPEFLNRFDEVVLFKPLEKTELLSIVDMMIANVNKTLSAKKISIKVALDAREYLVESGNDPKLGARPMQRIIQRAVENIVANQVISGQAESGSEITISLEQVSRMLEKNNNAQGLINNK